MALTAGNIGFTGYQQPDYSGVVQASGLPMQAIGQGVAQATDYFKKQKESKNMATMGIKIAEAAKIMDPVQAPYYDSLITNLKDENTPVDVRGQLGASIQDLLKQNTSMRAVAVQEAQLGRMPDYLGGGFGRPQPQGGVSQPGQSMDYPAFPSDMPIPGQAGADLLQLQEYIAKAQELGVPSDRVNQITGGITQAIVSGSPQMDTTIKAYSNDLASLVSKAAEGFKPVMDAKGNPLVQIVEDEGGNISRFTKTKGGNLIDAEGNFLDSQGNPLAKPEYQDIDLNAIQQAIGGYGVLPEIDTMPPTSMVEPVGTPEQREMLKQMEEEGQGRAMANNDPQMAPSAAPPQPSQERMPMAIMSKESIAASNAKANEEYTKLTQLSPRKAKLYESAVTQAYQDPNTAPSQDVVEEMKQQLLMQPETKGPQIMSEDEYNRRNIATLNKAKVRVRDRAGVYKILERYDAIQRLANHPEGYKVFGESKPAEELAKLARTEGGVYALFENIKGQDLVQAMRDIKEQSGTAAAMSERETFALQAAVNDLSVSQDWKSAQKSLMQAANAAIRAGKKLGADESIFETMPASPGAKRQTTKANEILNSPDPLPVFRDEVEYFKKLEKASSRVPAQQAQPQAPAGSLEASLLNLNKEFGLR
jgi:hypothetical protein